MRKATSITRLRLTPSYECMRQHIEFYSHAYINLSSFFNFLTFSSHSLCGLSLINLNFKYLMPWPSKKLGTSAEQFIMYANLFVTKNSAS